MGKVRKCLEMGIDRIAGKIISLEDQRLGFEAKDQFLTIKRQNVQRK